MILQITEITRFNNSISSMQLCHYLWCIIVYYYLSSNRRFEKHFCEDFALLLVGNNGVRHSERNCADRSSRGWVIRSNSAAARRFRLSGYNRSGPPRAARNQTCNGMELRGNVLFANLLIPIHTRSPNVEGNEFSQTVFYTYLSFLSM